MIMCNKNRQLIVSLLGIVSLFLITIGVTYAVFSYTKEGTTDNIITTGTLKFLYTENSAGGTGINISEAEPISDTQGKELVGDNNVFDFKVEGTNTGSEVIPYEVTLRKKDTSTMSEDNIKVYLQDGTDQTDLLTPTLYSKLMQTNIDVGSNIEKTLYKGEVAGNTDNYLKTFRLRMWIDENSNQNDINGKSFTGMVNVYSNAKVTENTTSTLKNEIMKNPIIEAEPTLTTSSNNTTDVSGLYKSTATNTGDPTYYFRGTVENNYVSFAGQTWRIVRINEDGTLRLIISDYIIYNNTNPGYTFSTNYTNYTYMYYTNSDIKPILKEWFEANIGNNEEYSKHVATGNYYCEQAKVKPNSNNTSENAEMIVYDDYVPDFKCKTDDNGYGLIDSNVGLISYDEIVYAGGYFQKYNDKFYLYTNRYFWTASPAGLNGVLPSIWVVSSTGDVNINKATTGGSLRPVINLKANTPISLGDGSKDNPFVIE